MDVTRTDLAHIGQMAVDYYDEHEENILSVIVYGGAAKIYVGYDTPRATST